MMYKTYLEMATGPGAMEGLSAFDAYLVQKVTDGEHDQESGSVEWDVWFALVGRHLVYTDDHGFWYVQHYDTVADAAAVYNRWDHAYGRWQDTQEVTR